MNLAAKVQKNLRTSKKSCNFAAVYEKVAALYRCYCRYAHLGGLRNCRQSGAHGPLAFDAGTYPVYHRRAPHARSRAAGESNNGL